MTNPMQKIFQRGQVWHWTDPEYLSKGSGINVHEELPGYHYSRYVIIVQDPSTAPRKEIMVVPISSGARLIHDVGIEINHLYFSKRSYAKVQAMFAANPRCLDQYVCEIDKKNLQVIDGELLKIFFPSLVRNISVSELRSYGIELINKTLDRKDAIADELVVNLKGFFKKHIHYTHNKSDVLSIQDLFTAYEKYCIRNDLYIEDNLAYFCNACIHLVNAKITSKVPNCRFARESTIQEMVFYRMTLVNTDHLNSIEVDADGIEDLCVCPNDIVVPTPDGDCMMGDLNAGDKVFGIDGSTATIAGVHHHYVKNNNDDETEWRPSIGKTNSKGKQEHDIPEEVLKLTDNEIHKPGKPWTVEQMKAYVMMFDKFGKKFVMGFYELTETSAIKYDQRFRSKLNVNTTRKNTAAIPVNTDSEKKAFLKYFETHGAVETAKKYKIKPVSVYQRLKRIRASINNAE